MNPADARFEPQYTGEDQLSPLAWLGIGTGVSVIIGLVAWVVIRKDADVAPDSLLSRPRFSQFASSEKDYRPEWAKGSDLT